MKIEEGNYKKKIKEKNENVMKQEEEQKKIVEWKN
jgi:hypothetical protein